MNQLPTLICTCHTPETYTGKQTEYSFHPAGNESRSSFFLSRQSRTCEFEEISSLLVFTYLQCSDYLLPFFFFTIAIRCAFVHSTRVDAEDEIRAVGCIIRRLIVHNTHTAHPRFVNDSRCPLLQINSPLNF